MTYTLEMAEKPSILNYPQPTETHIRWIVLKIQNILLFSLPVIIARM